MNINQLEYLIATIDLGSYVRAAKSLYVTPQAVAKGISDLEKELKIKLFVKLGRGIEATSDGALLATKATEIIQGCEDLKRYADALGCDSETGAFGSLRIAIASSPHEGGVISRALLDKLARRYPGIDLGRRRLIHFRAVFSRVMPSASALGTVLVSHRVQFTHLGAHL